MSGFGTFKAVENGKVYTDVQFLVVDGCTGEMTLHRFARNKLEASYFTLTEDTIIKNESYDHFGLSLSTSEDRYHINRHTVENGEIHVDIKNKQIHLKNTLKHYVGNVFWQVTIDFADIKRIESTNRYQEDITQEDLQKKRDSHILEHGPMHNDCHKELQIVNNF